MYLRGYMGQTTNLGFFRPNQAEARFIYAPRNTLGQVEVDPSLLLVGVAVLAGAFFLLGGRWTPRIRARRRARLQRKLAALGD